MGWMLTYENSSIEILECDTCTNSDHDYINFKKVNKHFSMQELEKIVLKHMEEQNGRDDKN